MVQSFPLWLSHEKDWHAVRMRVLASCVPPHASDGRVQIVLTDDTPCQIWLTNFGATSAELGPAELFGFNVGSFCEKPQGRILS